MPLPDLVAVQRDSFKWFLEEGIAETLTDISPIEDFTGSLKLELADPEFEPPKYSEEECKEKDMTFSRPLFVTARFMNAQTGEIKEQTVFMGDFPMMTEKGTFIINGTERIVVSQLVRSPGVYFGITPDKTSPDLDIIDAKVIPGRGAWLEFEVDKKNTAYVRIDRKRKQPVTVLLKALGMGDDPEALRTLLLDSKGQPFESIANTLDRDHTETVDDAFLDIYRKLRPGEPPTVESARGLLENLFFNPKRYDLAKVGRHKVNKKLKEEFDALEPVLERSASSARPTRPHADPGRHPGHGLLPGEAPRPRARPLGRRHRPLRQPPDPVGGRAHPEPGPHRPLPDGAGRPGAHDHAGRRGHHAPDADQHPAGRGRHQGVLRVLAAVAVHGPDEPAVRPDPQAAPLGPRPRRSLPGAGRLRGA